MRPLNLEEFANQLRMEGNEFADEILELVHLEEQVAEPYSVLCEDLSTYASGVGEPLDQLKWLGNRSTILEEIEEELEKAGQSGDPDEMVKGVLGTLEEAEDILKANGWNGEGYFLDALQALADRVPAMEYDL